MKRLTLLLLCITFFNTINAQLNLDSVGRLQYGNSLNDVWAYVDSAGNEYALVGVRNKTSIVDISDPTNPVELFAVPGPRSTWRDIKTWKDRAYIVHGGTQGGDASIGMQIIDLSNLPTSISTITWTGGGLNILRSHNLWIDENGIAYLLGSNYNPGATFLDLTVPDSPVYIGEYNTAYIHDAFVRGDTMWAAEIWNGWFSVVDVSNKTTPVIMATQLTPDQFTHNIWVNKDNSAVFTTDEVNSAYTTAYDVTDLSNIKEVDRYRPEPGTGTIPHNAHILNDYIILSYYGDGIIILDILDPANMVEVGNYNTSSGSGVWGVYPFLPSETLAVSDIGNGLWLLAPTYVRSSRVEGTVTDSITGIPLNGATVTIVSTAAIDNTDSLGAYKMGVVDSGFVTIQVMKPGYTTKTISGVNLSPGVATKLNVELVHYLVLTVGVVDQAGYPVPFAHVFIDNGVLSYTEMTNSTGILYLPIDSGIYDFYAGKWEYITSQTPAKYINVGTSGVVMTIYPGLYDDFLFDFGWTVSGNASGGMWTRGIPVGTTYNTVASNPYFDSNQDWGEKAYVTGNLGGFAGNDDVDGGNTVLTSPIFSLCAYDDPQLNFSRWFFNDGGFGGDPNDSVAFALSNGLSTIQFDAVLGTIKDSSGATIWEDVTLNIADYIQLTDQMQFIIQTADNNPGHLVEAALDHFRIENGVLPGQQGPKITGGIPDDQQANVILNTVIQVQFDKEVDPASFTYTIDPVLTNASEGWNVTSNQVTIFHDNLQPMITYTLEVIGAADLNGNPLLPSCELNPRTFTTGETVGIRDIHAVNGISVFPNPSTGLFTMLSDEAVNVLIFDLLGQLVWKGTVQNSTIIDLSLVPKGVYFYKVKESSAVGKLLLH